MESDWIYVLGEHQGVTQERQRQFSGWIERTKKTKKERQELTSSYMKGLTDEDLLARIKKELHKSTLEAEKLKD